MTTRPSRVPIVFAWTMPLMLSTVSAKAPRAAARISIEPPSAWIRPSCCSRFFASVALVWKNSRPSPSTSTETAFAATMPTRPPLATIVPVLLTVGPARTTVPPGAEIVPSLRTSPRCAGARRARPR